MWWCTTIIPAPWDAEAGGPQTPAESEQFNETLSQNKNKTAGDVAQCKVPGFNS